MSKYDHLCGFYPIEKWDSVIHRQVNDYISTLTNPIFEMSQAYSDIRSTGEGQDVFFWNVEKKLLGRILPSYHQKRGTCVSQGWGRMIQDQMFIDIALRREAERVPDDCNPDKFIATEYIYGIGRVEIGGGRLSGDGCVASWAARGVQEYGFLTRKKYGRYDLTNENDTIAVSWGRRGNGTPDTLERVGREHPVNEVSTCKSYEAARDAIANLNGVPVASTRGFTTTRKDGFCSPRGRWNHQMYFRGCGIAKGNRPFLACQNSWGNRNPGGSNKLTLETGQTIELPPGCFAVDAEVCDYMLRSGDCHIASGVKGFRKIRKRDYLDLI